MKEVSRLLSLKRITTTPYHPVCSGLVKKFNGTLKQMLKLMCSKRPEDWDKYFNALLFAYREVPHESLGFSPFELLYGRPVRGPMMILKELWTNKIPDDAKKIFLPVYPRLERETRRNMRDCLSTARESKKASAEALQQENKKSSD
mgnify:CR=1 FL=1